MATIVKFGNLPLNEIEKSLGIVFSSQDEEFFKNTRQENVREGLKPISWHFFEIPKQLELGSYKMFLKVQEIFSKYNLKGTLQLSFTLAEDEKIANNFQLTDKSGFPKYIVSKRGFTRFYELVKINKVTLVYKPVETQEFYKDVLGIEEFILNELEVPLPNTYLNNSTVKISKDKINDSTPEKEILRIEHWENDIETFKVWNGEAIKRW